MKNLSVIIPSYNMEKYLPKCLGSLIVAPELMEKLEVLIVNDGSKDRTSEIAHGFAEKWPETFKVLDKKNGNYGSCINAALPEAAGRFVKVLDADDSFDTAAFGEFLTYISCQTEPFPDLILTDYDEVDETGAVMRHVESPIVPNRTVSVGEFLNARSDVQMHAFAYKTSVVREMGYRQLEGVSYTDVEWVRIPMLKVRTLVRCPVTLYKYLVGRVGQTMDAQKRAKSWWMVGEVALDMLRQFGRLSDGCSEEVREEVLRRILGVVELVYSGAICGISGCRGIIDLKEFDDRLRLQNEDAYARMNRIVYSQRLPYHYVRAWRCRALSRLVMIPICKTYTKLAVLCGVCGRKTCNKKN